MKYIQRLKRRFQAVLYKIVSRGAKSPQSELGYIAPDSLFLFCGDTSGVLFENETGIFRVTALAEI